MELRMHDGSINARVSKLVDAMFAQKGLPPVVIADSLRDQGLKSMDVFNLMLAVEDEFGLTIPQSQMTAATFHSVESIQGLVSMLV